MEPLRRRRVGCGSAGSVALRAIVTAIALPLLLAAVPSRSQAQTGTQAQPPSASRPPDPAALDGDIVTVGIGVGLLSDYEGSDHYSLFPIPGATGTIRGHDFTVLGNRASLDLVKNRTGPVWSVAAGPLAVIDFNRGQRSAIDDPRVRALPTRGIAVELGGYVGIAKTGVITSPYDTLSLSVSYRHDVTGVHDSGIVSPMIDYFTPLSRKSAIALFVSGEHVGRGYLASYFDVTPADSIASGLPVFTGRGGWKSWSAGGLGTIAVRGDLLRGWKLVGGVTYSRMLGDAADSPLVRIAGSRSQWLGALGVAYTF